MKKIKLPPIYSAAGVAELTGRAGSTIRRLGNTDPDIGTEVIGATGAKMSVRVYTESDIELIKTRYGEIARRGNLPKDKKGNRIVEQKEPVKEPV